MSWYQMGNPGRAREALKVARERYTLTSNDDDSSNHLILCVLRREAEALLAGDAGPGVSRATRRSPPAS